MGLCRGNRVIGWLIYNLCPFIRNAVFLRLTGFYQHAVFNVHAEHMCCLIWLVWLYSWEETAKVLDVIWALFAVPDNPSVTLELRKYDAVWRLPSASCMSVWVKEELNKRKRSVSFKRPHASTAAVKFIRKYAKITWQLRDKRAPSCGSVLNNLFAVSLHIHSSFFVASEEHRADVSG